MTDLIHQKVLVTLIQPRSQDDISCKYPLYILANFTSIGTYLAHIKERVNLSPSSHFQGLYRTSFDPVDRVDQN